jgi:hypothetical protein
MLLSPNEVLTLGLQLLEAKSARWSNASKDLEFQRHYGSAPLVLADIWYDLTVGDYVPEDLRLGKKENSEKGFKMFMVTNFWLWKFESQ